MPAIDLEKLTEQNDDVRLPIEDRIFLREAMSRLKTLERKVVHHFYYLDLNQTEIARKLGISVNYASYLLRGAVAKLRKAVEAQQEASAQQHEAAPTRPASGAYSLSLRPAPADPTTKLATEAHFLERLEAEVERACRYPQQFSILLLAADRHDLPADDVISLAKLLRGNVRSIDLVASLRGSRFGLLLPHTGREAGVLAERIVRTVASRVAVEDAPLTISTGIACFPNNGRSCEELLFAAEEALDEASRQGGNRFVRSQAAPRTNGRAAMPAG
jgi:diguanylate cyclase (GGDEF)-like protein